SGLLISWPTLDWAIPVFSPLLKIGTLDPVFKRQPGDPAYIVSAGRGVLRSQGTEQPEVTTDTQSKSVSLRK
ncbi:hypothetical protein LCGC14_2984460, partial [marine sediment metagenome]